MTGFGAVSAAGWGADVLWKALTSGETAIGTLDVFDPSSHRTQCAGQVPGPEPDLALLPAVRKRSSRTDRFALFAAREALRRAELDLGSCGDVTGVFFGSSTGGMREGETWFVDLRNDPSRGGRAGRLACHQNNAPGDFVARQLGVSGSVETIASACSAATMAIGIALDAVRSGEVQVAITGGSDGLCQLTYGGFNSLRAVGPGPCRPFRGDRDGLSLGEGAGVLVLESLEHARARRAVPILEFRGAAASCDAYHMTAPDPSGAGAAAALRQALEDARLNPADIDFVNAHGTGTPLNDAAEWAALRAAFGERATQVPLTSSKGVVAHLLGACGALEAVATIQCLEAGLVHPTPGTGEIDPQIPARLVTGDCFRPLRCRAAASWNLGFGGANAALVFACME